ncbi:glucose-1-phosphate thymidylyltransferase [bacterium]|nr:glucose-1-phosphate thymidylyltransferase [bacterium]MBU1025395.1 glucose-1-phosphate thymidylyltransferase [bacterium]
MKGLILAGGKGTRLRPLTYTSAKQLIPVANKPILFYGLESMAAAGIREIGIVVGDTHLDIRKACGDGSQWGVSITYIQQDQPLGLAHAVKISQEFLGEDKFCMYLGDNLLKDGITNLIQEYEKSRANAMILLTQVPNPQQFGVAEVDMMGNITRLIEKPAAPKSNLALVGVYLFDKRIFQACEAIRPSERGELEITDAIQFLIVSGYIVKPSMVTGWWKDTGKRDDLLEANRLVLQNIMRDVKGEIRGRKPIEGNVIIPQEALIIDSRIRGPVIIGKDAKIENSYIGPFTSIGPGVHISGSEIEHSIVMQGAEILNLNTRLVDCVLGRNSLMTMTDERPKAVRAMLGDNSQVYL